MTSARGSCIEMYRVDVSGVSWPLLAVATLFVIVGGLGIGAAFVTHGWLSESRLVPLAGSACMLAGPLLAVLAMRNLIMQDEYVAALDGGLLVQIEKRETYWPWRSIDRVHWLEETNALVVTPSEGEPLVIAKTFSRGSTKEMAQRLEDLRRKAAFRG